jgi:Mce-associated membrane protein
VDDPSKKTADALGAAEALSLADEAEAEAAEAEAVAAAARARARAIRLRREATQAAESRVEEAAAQTAVVADEPAEETPEAETVVGEKPDIVIDEPQEEPGVEPEKQSASSRRRWGMVVGIVATTLAVLLTGALLFFSGWMVMQHRKAVDDQKLSADYAAAGRQSVVTLMSLDFKNAKDDVQRIIDNSTGQFKTDFQNQAQDFVKVAQDSKVVTDVTVNSTAVESMTKDSAVVLVAATSRVTNSAGAKQEPRAWRLSVGLQRDNGQIKMAKVEFVP